MEDLDDREAFLRAIFADPDNDLPRLVFADWLDERGESAWAELIRVQCELGRTDIARIGEPDVHALRVREVELVRPTPGSPYPDRGFLPRVGIFAPADLLGDPVEFRRTALREHPEWYGCDALKVDGGTIVGGKPIHTMLNSPVTERVTDFDLSGTIIALRDPLGESGGGEDDSETYQLLSEYEYRPAITVQAVQALVDAREARRVVRLDLRNNDLDNDAARAILQSTNLTRLQSLLLFDGNQLRGRTWTQLLARFGPDVLQ